MPDSMTPGDKAPPGFDLSAFREIIGDDRGFLGEFIAIFEQDSARLTLEIRRALIGRDARALQRSAHSLKGMLSHFGESRALDLARGMEEVGFSRDLGRAEAIESALLEEIALIRVSLRRLVR